MPKKAKNINKNKNKNVNKNVVNIKIHNDTKKRRRSSKPKKALQVNAPPTNGYASFSPQISVYPQLYPPQMVGSYYRDAMMPTQPNTLADFTIPRSQSMQTQIPSEIQTNNVETPITLSEKINEEFQSGFKTPSAPPPPFTSDPSPIIPPVFSSGLSHDVKKRRRNVNNEQPQINKAFEHRINQLSLQEFKKQLSSAEISNIKWTKKGLPKNKGMGKRFNVIRAETRRQELINDDDL